jgi:putative transposase
MPHASRAHGVGYLGEVRLFVTAVTDGRVDRFKDEGVAAMVATELLRASELHKVEVTAYAVLSDHVHALLTGESPNAGIPATLRRWKQFTGYWFSKTSGARLWQKNYWDRLIRDDDEMLRSMRYVVRNPIRHDLATGVRDYRWFGSTRWPREDLIELAESHETPHWWPRL